MKHKHHHYHNDDESTYFLRFFRFTIKNIKQIVKTNHHHIGKFWLENEISSSPFSKDVLYELEIDRANLENLISMYKDYISQSSKQDEEEKLRERHPSLDNAYQQYQMILGLVKN